MKEVIVIVLLVSLAVVLSIIAAASPGSPFP